LIVVGGVLQAYAGGIFHLAIYIIVVGGIILIVSFFGCCGAIKENRCMLLSVRLHAERLTISTYDCSVVFAYP